MRAEYPNPLDYIAGIRVRFRATNSPMSVSYAQTRNGGVGNEEAGDAADKADAAAEAEADARAECEDAYGAEDALTGCRAMRFALQRMQHIVPETSVSVTKPRTASLRESGGLWERQAQHRSG